MPWRRKRQPTPVILPGESHGQRRLVSYSPWGRRVRHDWSALAHTHACCSGYQSTSFKAEQRSTVWNPSICDAHSGVSRLWLLWVVLLRTCVTRTCVSFCFQSSGVYTQEWNCWVIWCLYVSLFEEQPNCRPEQMIHVLSPAAKRSSSIIGPICTNTFFFLNYYFSGYEVNPSWFL